MNREETIANFNRLYIGDSLVQRVELLPGKAECRITFNAGKVLKEPARDIFDPESRFEPALLILRGVRSIACEGANYQLNSTVVDFGAYPSGADEHIEFRFELTGGTDASSFMVTMRFIALTYEFCQEQS